jgi:hypothetical protein
VTFAIHGGRKTIISEFARDEYQEPQKSREGVNALHELAYVVPQQHRLPGVPISHDSFLPVPWSSQDDWTAVRPFFCFVRSTAVDACQPSQAKRGHGTDNFFGPLWGVFS